MPVGPNRRAFVAGLGSAAAWPLVVRAQQPDRVRRIGVLGATGSTGSGISVAVSHLLIDVNEAIDPNEPIPQDKNHLHFGTGQTEARIELPPGKHTLQLVLGDAKHFPFKPPVVSKKITVFIK